MIARRYKQMNHETAAGRRTFLRAAGAAFTTSLLSGSFQGANDRIGVGFVGMGIMGAGNLDHCMKQPNTEVVAVCDVYQPHLERAVEQARQGGHKPKECRDFRDVLADKSIDAVCISTPDHWHAYMTAEACKAGKDVYVEKPASVTVDEGRKMVEAARKYKRIVQVGTMQRSGVLYQKACELIRSGQLGKVSFVRFAVNRNVPVEGYGNPPDSDPPPGLDWDMWLGPAPKRPFNANRFGVYPGQWSSWRYFWDYAGGDMTDNGVHGLDIVQMVFNEVTPASITALGGTYRLRDNRETPDTMEAVFEYPEFTAAFEVRLGNAQSFGASGIVFYGDRGTLCVSREHLGVIPEKGSDLKAVDERVPDVSEENRAHWANFLQSMSTRQKPVSDIGIGHRSTTTCLLGNVAFRGRRRLDWDSRNETTVQKEARSYLARDYRKPWKLEI